MKKIALGFFVSSVLAMGAFAHPGSSSDIARRSILQSTVSTEVGLLRATRNLLMGSEDLYYQASEERLFLIVPLLEASAKAVAMEDDGFRSLMLDANELLSSYRGGLLRSEAPEAVRAALAIVSEMDDYREPFGEGVSPYVLLGYRLAIASQKLALSHLLRAWALPGVGEQEALEEIKDVLATIGSDGAAPVPAAVARRVREAHLFFSVMQESQTETPVLAIKWSDRLFHAAVTIMRH
jgi:hypothetical protein